MEQILDDSLNNVATDNNNVTDNLEILKENQLNTLENIEKLEQEQENKTDNRTELDAESNIKFENLIENKESDELIKELTNQLCETTNQIDEKGNNFTIETFTNSNDLSESTKQENLLDQLNESNLLDQSVQETHLEDHSTQQINLIENSDENLISDQLEPSLLDQISNEQTELNNKELLTTLLSDDKSEKNECLDDLNEEINETNSEFINNIKTEEVNQNEVKNNQSPDQSKLTFDDCVTKNEEIKINESENASLPIEETFMVKKLDECNLSSIETKNEIEDMNKPVLNEKLNLDNEEPVTSKSKVDDIFTQSQELLKQADKLIAEKRSSINEVIIPGLDVEISSESITKEKTTDDQKQPEQSTKMHESLVDPSTTDNKQLETNESINNNTKQSKSSSKKCIIS